MKEAIEPFVKILTGVTTALCIWMASTLIDVQRKVYGLEIEINHVRTFTSKPRFTQEDFRDQIAPVVQRVEQIEKQLDK